MFDFKHNAIKSVTPKELLNNSLLDFHTDLNLRTGELTSNNSSQKKLSASTKNKKNAEYRQCNFEIINDKYINFKGSIHKYFNDGENHNDFNVADLFQTIQDIHNKFNFNPFLSELHNIEFGVNLILPFDTKKFLKSIISMNGRECENRTYNGKGYLIKFVFGDVFEVKIYDKGFQFGLKRNTLRFEIKVRKMEFLHAKGINLRTDIDLLNPVIHSKLGELLTKYHKKIIFWDNSINLKEVKPRERETLINGRNPKYWNQLKETEPENFKKRLLRYRELVSKYGKIKMHETVLRLISEKWKQLSELTPETKSELNEYLEQLKTKTFPKITDFQKKNFPQYDTSNSMLEQGNNYELTSTTEKRFCLSCGRDITEQKKGSKFCSEKIYGAEVKRCRNIDSNPRNYFKRREKKIKEKGLLFYIEPDISRLKLNAIVSDDISNLHVQEYHRLSLNPHHLKN